MSLEHNRILAHMDFDFRADLPADEPQQRLIEDDPGGIPVLSNGL